MLEPIAEVEIVSLDPSIEFTLTESDLEKVFERFGHVKSVSMTRHNVAHVKMNSYNELNSAINFLNFRELKSQAKLTVKWVFDDVKEVQKAISHDETFLLQHQQTKINAKCTSMNKFTCKYEVQIPTNTSFQTARKIIGFRGCNMKRILEEC